MNIGEKIKAFREMTGMTQRDLSVKSHVALNTIKRIEADNSPARGTTYQALATAMGVELIDIQEDREFVFSVVVDKDAYLPCRAHEDDAGFDLFSPISTYLSGGGSVVIDTGVHIEIPKGFAGLICSKSGLNIKKGIISDGLIDSGYTGSICVKLYNLSNSAYVIERGDKISQIMFVPIVEPTLREVDALDDTERGENGFGSTGR